MRVRADMDMDGHRRAHATADQASGSVGASWPMPDKCLPDLTGRSRDKPLFVSDELPHYATVHKTREAGRVVQVERRVVYGSEHSVQQRLANSPSQTINTAYVERSNLDWRLWNAHLVRKAPTFARSLRWLRAKFAIVVACYNLIRPHGTLSRGQHRFSRFQSLPAFRAFSCPVLS